MKTASIVALFAAAITAVNSSNLYDNSLSARHRQLAARSPPRSKRCPPRSKSPPKQNPVKNATPGPQGPQNGPPVGAPGLINVKSTCGPIGATHDITATSGPNGKLDWLDCGVNGGGWNPQYVTLSDLVTADLGNAIKDPNSPFHTCKPFVSLFEKYGNENGLPPILVASIAMQESSCDPSTVGGAGEQGLMQITKDKCGGAPGGNCKDPNFNIKTGAAFIKSLVDSSNGNVLKAIGHYNGWFQGMTVGDATKAAHTSCCRCQQNLDYLHQLLNGWCQNINSYDHNPPLGEYWNLKQCGNY